METSFADRVTAARPRITAVVRRLAGDDAEDVVQEAILRAFLSSSQLREPERFESWLCGIAINVAKMRLRRAAVHARAVAALGHAHTEGGERELLQAIREALGLLPPAQRDAVLLHYVDGLSCAEVAELVGSTQGAVRVRLHRARETLRRELAPHAPVTYIRKERSMIEMVVDDVIVRVDAEQQANVVWDQRIVVLRERDGERLLPIWMGAGEGNALAARLREAEIPRPMTADLMAELVRLLGGRVECVAVVRLEESTFYATVTVDGTDVDARPSDAINLAVRVGAPILVADEVLETAAVSREALDAKYDSASDRAHIPEGEWRSLSSELLETLHRMPR